MFMGAISRDGLDIARRSREIVREKIRKVLGKDIDKYSEWEMKIIERVVHATADVEYAKLIRFKNHPIEKGIEGVKSNCPMVVDVEMVKVGIRYNNIVSFINDKKVYEIAKEEGITRAAAAMRIAKSYIHGGIVIVGNAPTALFEVVRLIEEEEVEPRLVIGVPVGFVKASESKKLLHSIDVPFITTEGPKGGTPVAVSIANGIVELSRGKMV
ncbi:cobalt-precorrin-8 methylmutase [Methanofervidicoccus abyssi]|uniref:Precorrin-8X/cobalt-precorrin-8 methylmutase n=1 Tax=Methanofervidicoccus abyssi TaxID=2082189 RepID=A0A401HRH3_9EURY|nr:cobalt-precorrin-8 methylmutase [Methanofervidicoccus abyssi]GBF36792.1 precorrin-8X/cobalt-precorrin-8 methylmutase [Methanofervidicoccus abyssi]